MSFDENATIEIIYTHEYGQVITTISLISLSNFFFSKKEMERQLNLFWEIIKGTNKLMYGKPVENRIGALVKISTCIKSRGALPKWHGEWDGKFYYNQEIVN